MPVFFEQRHKKWRLHRDEWATALTHRGPNPKPSPSLHRAKRSHANECSTAPGSERERERDLTKHSSGHSNITQMLRRWTCLYFPLFSLCSCHLFCPPCIPLLWLSSYEYCWLHGAEERGARTIMTKMRGQTNHGPRTAAKMILQSIALWLGCSFLCHPFPPFYPFLLLATCTWKGGMLFTLFYTD